MQSVSPNTPFKRCRRCGIETLLCEFIVRLGAIEDLCLDCQREARRAKTKKKLTSKHQHPWILSSDKHVNCCRKRSPKKYENFGEIPFREKA